MIAIDTGILIWGVREQPDPGRPDLIQQCKLLIADHAARKIPIMVSSVVLAEYLMKMDDETRLIQLAIISKNYSVRAFDSKAAAVAAELYNKELFDNIREEDEIARQCLKTDLKILANAISAGATTFYADDKHFKKMARGKILVEPIPDLPPPPPVDPQISLPFGSD